MPVQRRPSGYVSRTVVPHDLRPTIGRREIVRNLKTGSSREAKRRAAEFEGHVAALFRRLRHDGQMMERDQIDALVAQYLKASLDEVEETLAEGLAISGAAGRDVWYEGVYGRLVGTGTALAEGDYTETLATARTLLPNGSPTALAVLARRLLEAKQEALRAELKALEGEPLRRPVIAGTPSAPTTPPKPSPLLSQVVTDYASFKKTGGKWTPKTALQLLNLFRVMVEMVGDKPIRDITKEDMRELYRLLPQMPAHATKRYPGMVATDAIAAADADGQDERLSPKTQNDYFTHIKSLFKWAVENDYLDKSPAVVLKDVDETAAWDQRPAFTDKQLPAYFAEIHAQSDPAMLWVARLMLFAGLRTEEAAKLTPEDIRQEQGVWIVDINRKVGRLKTKNADRLVPIHGAILPELLKYTEGRPQGVNLWGLTANRFGTFSAALSGRLNSALDRACPENDRLVTYSLRHTFATRLKYADATDYLDELLGHKVEKLSTGRYGKRYPVEKLRDAVERLKVPKLI